MFCKNCTLIVIISFYIAAIGRAAEPDANADSSLANVATAAINKWSTLEWKMGASSPFTRVESPAAVIKGKLYLFGGFTDDLQASNQIDKLPDGRSHFESSTIV